MSIGEKKLPRLSTSAPRSARRDEGEKEEKRRRGERREKGRKKKNVADVSFPSSPTCPSSSPPSPKQKMITAGLEPAPFSVRFRLLTRRSNQLSHAIKFVLKETHFQKALKVGKEEGQVVKVGYEFFFFSFLFFFKLQPPFQTTTSTSRHDSPPVPRLNFDTKSCDIRVASRERKAR